MSQLFKGYPVGNLPVHPTENPPVASFKEQVRWMYTHSIKAKRINVFDLKVLFRLNFCGPGAIAEGGQAGCSVG